jgi:hypothetical protein
MNNITRLAAGVAAAALLAACSSGPHGSPVAASAPAPTRSPAAHASARSPAPASSHSSAGAAAASPAAAGRLTYKQAKVAYVRIVDPGAALANKLAGAASGTAPFSQFRGDALAYVKELRSEIGKIQAVHWPANVQPHITTMITTDFPSDIGCLQAEVAAGNMTAAEAVTNSNKDCQVADNSTIPSTLQSLLG